MSNEQIADLSHLNDKELADMLLTWAVFKESPLYYVGYHLDHGSTQEILIGDIDAGITWISQSNKPEAVAIKHELRRRFDHLFQEKP